LQHSILQISRDHFSISADHFGQFNFLILLSSEFASSTGQTRFLSLFMFSPIIGGCLSDSAHLRKCVFCIPHSLCGMTPVNPHY
jgi:hypothetical protein